MPEKRPRGGKRGTRAALRRGFAGTALLTATAVLTGLVYAVPATADTAPEEDTGLIRNSIGEDPRLDRCVAGVALHVGGAAMKAKAIEGLAGTREELNAIVGQVGWIGLEALGQAGRLDEEAGIAYRDLSQERKLALEASNKVYAQSYWGDDDAVTLHAPEFAADVLQFTLFTQDELADSLGSDGHTMASAESIAKARELAESQRGEDDWNDAAVDMMLDDAGSVYFNGTSSSDVGRYLRQGGFPAAAPPTGSAEFRVEVEDLKTAWAACDHQNPVDARKVMNPVVLQAMAEWEGEYAAQAAPRNGIIKAEADAAAQTRIATDHMIVAIGQAWRAEQILLWQKHWEGIEDSILRPEPEVFTQAVTELATARANVAAEVTKAKAASAAAGEAAQRAAAAQETAWGIADTQKVPRGRGLMYAQQSVQVARASAAAAEAASKATETALQAANATAADSQALLALAQTKAHAIDTEFRRIAAQEAASQAKAAADSAEGYATAAAEQATLAATSRKRAEAEEKAAGTAAATAQAKKIEAGTERAAAAASRATAAAQRGKAEEAEARAQTEKTAAESAKSAAAAASAIAAAKRTSSETAAEKARTAREAAVLALRRKEATAARAAALRAAAAAAEGTAAAAETRQAADEADTAASQAATAATGARTAADTATAASVTARAAATQAHSAAQRARAASGQAWAAYWVTAGSAAASRAAAADAITASEEAAQRAKVAAWNSTKASEQAALTITEAEAARNAALATAASAAEPVGLAYAAGQAAVAARDTADKAINAANTAIAVGTPYQQTDASAAFAVLIGQTSKTYAEQQAAAAGATADEAAQFAALAQQLADQASGDAKIAAQAAADAAADASRAVGAVERAQASAKAADTSAGAAVKAAEGASAHASDAGEAAVHASGSASDAESDAAAANLEATETERQEEDAHSAADDAEREAAAAKAAAAEAEQDAASAESDAGTAQTDAEAAEGAADAAEEARRDQNEQEREEALENGGMPVLGGGSNWPALGSAEEKILLDACGQDCVDDYQAALNAASVDILDWTSANGGQILLDEFGTAQVKSCLSQNDIESCLWDLADVPSLAVIVGKIPAINAAIVRISDGVAKLYSDADDAMRTLEHLVEVVDGVRSDPRLDRCVAGVALHAGGAEMKAKAIEGLSGTTATLDTVVGQVGWIGLEPLGQAALRDEEAALAYRSLLNAREEGLEDANRVYAMTSFSDEITLHAPEFGEDVLGYTLATQTELANRLGSDDHSMAGAESVARAREIAAANSGKDSWHDFAADVMLDDAGNEHFNGTSSSDVGRYLRHGGFLSKPPVVDSPEYRVEVESLKASWAACDHRSPVDPRHALNAVVVDAYDEWEAEYTSQAEPRGRIIRAEAQAAGLARTATDDMVEAIGQAWLAEQILLWQKYWQDQPKDSILRPKAAVFTKADSDLARARTNVSALVTSSKATATSAQEAATRAVTAQQDAWAIADTGRVPRGRGLMYAQQSVQVARASAAATLAASKATETAFNATNATVEDVKALLALAKTRTHAVNTEFRRIAAQEAASQAKAAADSADTYAADAAKQALIAKAAQKTAEEEREVARKAAESAAAQRLTAEAERAVAAAEAATAASERGKAETAEARAQLELTSASSSRAAADTAGATASSKRTDAENAESRARVARNRAVTAEQDEDAATARAAALEAAAAAAEGTDAAEETRAAATEARTAANEATAAAGRARTAANEASDAAIAARAAATRAHGAATRARASADSAWASYMTAAGAAASAHAAAAEAIDAAAAAAADVRLAEAESKKASAAALVAKQESDAANSEALLTAAAAAVTAGHAFAVAQAALAARDSATQTANAANQAISIGSPYQTTDAAAAFAVLAGQSALTLSEQLATASEAMAVEAAAFAAEAQALAEQAEGDAKLAAEAAAEAAKDALRAAAAVERARVSANEAAAASKAASKAANEASGYAQQAGTDAVYASFAASDAEGYAAAADRDATEAERDASSARAAATTAESEASSARSTATQAETDATAAEASAENAQGLAEEADSAATRAEEAERQRLLEERAAQVEAGHYDGPQLSTDDEELLRQMCGQVCVDEYNSLRDMATQDVIDWVIANGGQILLDTFGVTDIRNCLSTWDFESCMWALVSIGSIVIAVTKIPAVAKALYVIGSGARAFLTGSKVAKRVIQRYQDLLSKARKFPQCLVGRQRSASMRTASSDDEFKGDGWNIPGQCQAVQLTQDFIDNIFDYHFDDGWAYKPNKGVFDDDVSAAKLMRIAVKAQSACQGKWTTSLTEPNYRVCRFSAGEGIVGKNKRGGDLVTQVEVVISVHGVPITMYPV